MAGTVAGRLDTRSSGGDYLVVEVEVEGQSRVQDDAQVVSRQQEEEL